MADNLAQMFGAAPLVGASMFGQREAMAQQQEEMKRQELAQTIAKMQQEYEHTGQMNPLKIQNQGLQNQGLQEGLAGITADSQSKVLKAREESQTSAGRVDATNSGNRLKVLENGIKEGQMIDGVVTQALSEMETIPAPARMARLREIAAENNIDVNNPKVMGLLQKASQNPQLLMQIKQKTAERLAQMTPEWHREKMKEEAATKRNTDDNNTLRANAKTTANGKIAAAQARRDAQGEDLFKRFQEGRVPPANAAIMFEWHATTEDDPVKRERYRAMAEVANKVMLQQRPQPPRPDPNALGIPVVPEAQPVAGQGGGQAPAPKADTGDIGAAAKTAFGSYEPNKYMYRRNPETGKLQRALKE